MRLTQSKRSTLARRVILPFRGPLNHRVGNVNQGFTMPNNLAGVQSGGQGLEDYILNARSSAAQEMQNYLRNYDGQDLARPQSRASSYTSSPPTNSVRGFSPVSTTSPLFPVGSVAQRSNSAPTSYTSSRPIIPPKSRSDQTGLNRSRGQAQAIYTQQQMQDMMDNMMACFERTLRAVTENLQRSGDPEALQIDTGSLWRQILMETLSRQTRSLMD